MENIEVGQTAKDIVTGFEGVVACKTTYLYGVDRLGLQPRELKDGKPQESHDFDISQLKVTDTDKVLDMEPAEMTIPLGAKVRCTLTKFEGIVWSTSIFLNGCRRVGVAPSITKDNKIENNWFDENQLEIIQEDVIPEGKRNTGGPAPQCNDAWR